MSYRLLRTMAFALDPERAHECTIGLLEKVPHLAQFWQIDRRYEFSLQSNLGQVHFPIGLAAGLDKDARCLDFFSQLGFGFLEVGTVTWRPQTGNPRPRLWRLKEDESLRNAMGFNNHGPQFMLERLRAWRRRSQASSTLIGVNIGKNKDTPAQDAHLDYSRLYQALAPLADYMVINISSPNTPGLRDLQGEEGLTQILSGMEEVRKNCPRPLYIKVSPDLARDGLEAVVGLAQRFSTAGLIATNTTIMPALGAGGISGRLLQEKASLVRQHLLEMVQGTGLDVIGVGGISSFDDVWQFWRRGGKVAQIYSAFIYQGPGILSDISYGIERALKKTSCHGLAQMLSDWRLLPEKI